MEIKATEIQPGMRLADFAGVDVFVVRDVVRKQGDFVHWVVVIGDSPDGFFETQYDGEEMYYEYPTASIKIAS